MKIFIYILMIILVNVAFAEEKTKEISLTVKEIKLKMEKERRDWKIAAIPEISGLAGDKEWISKEIALLNTPTEQQNQRILAKRWLSDKMILMKSGEWFIYKSHCSKESPRNVRDIFITKGSDGKWYYTTCHFCVGMCSLRMMQEEPPQSLAFFIRRYHLEEFDGKSDECLKETQTFPDEWITENTNK